MKRLLFIFLLTLSVNDSFSKIKGGNTFVNNIDGWFQSSAHQEKKALSTQTKNLVSSQSNIVPACWVRQFALVERWIAGMRPTVSARAMTYIHMAAYETALPGMPDFVSNQTHIQGLEIPTLSYDPKRINWNIALNACYAKMDSVFLISA
ncbi:MAG TPA: hypothetical protein PLU10_10260, partial [Chitinophagaceae bacterium]|nr:hypothetical protein [Chitinophagaceae bacterium]